MLRFGKGELESPGELGAGVLIGAFFLPQGQLPVLERLRVRMIRGTGVGGGRGARRCRYLASLGLASSSAAGEFASMRKGPQNWGLG